MRPVKEVIKITNYSTKTFLKVHEAAEYYGIGRNRLYGAIKNKELKAYKPNLKTYLLKRTEIEAWIETFSTCQF
mgnify:CR=1 FL=1